MVPTSFSVVVTLRPCWLTILNIFTNLKASYRVPALLRCKEKTSIVIEVVRFEEFDLVALTKESCHRIAEIIFGRDGSIYVMFPNFTETEGLVAKVTYKGGVASTSIGLPEFGKVAGHLVKYSHHPDGRAFFSQTERVKSEIWKQSTPLSHQQTHLFKIQLDDLSGFGPPKQTNKTPQLTINIEGKIRALKILGRWYKLSHLRSSGAERNPRHPIAIMLPNGKQAIGWIVGPPINTPYTDLALFLAPVEIPPMASDEGSCLIFLGGFDPGDVALDLSNDTSFLCLKYPCSNPQELRKTIGSVDH